MKSAEVNARSVFEVIPGGLLFQDDFICPDKPREEWTPEETEEYNRSIWEAAESGTLEHVMKTMDITEEDLSTLIDTLEKIRSVLKAEAEAAGLRDEWLSMDTVYFLETLKICRQLRHW